MLKINVAPKVKTLAFFTVCGLILNLSHPLSSDEGTVLNGAWNILNGKVLYRDFFSFVAPGSYYLAFFSFKLFGVSYWSVKLTSTLLLLASVYCIYKLTLELTENHQVSGIAAWIWLFTGSIFYPIINYNPQSTYLATIAVYLFTVAVQKSKTSKFFYSGLITGLTTMFLQQKGLVLMAFLFVLLLAKMFSKKIAFYHFALFIFGFILPVTIVAFYFGPKTAYDNLILYNLNHNLTVNFLPPWILFLAFFITFIAFVINAKKLKTKSEIIFIIFLSQMALLIPLGKRLDIYHIFANIPFLWITSITPIWLTIRAKLNLLPKYQNLIISSFAFFLVFLVVVFYNIPVSGTYWEIQKKSEALGVNNFYSHPYQSGLYFELRKPNPYPYDILLTEQFPQEAWQKNLEVLKEQNPQFIFLSYQLAKHLKYDKNTTLDDYISHNYSQIDSVGTLQIMKRKVDSSIIK